MSTRRAAIVAALAGFAVLAIELAAVRLFAPSFGDSAFVWTNVIGVLLVALAAGAWLGGRLAARGDAARRARAVLVTAAVLVGLVPFCAPWLGRLLVPADLALEQAGGVLVWGSLAATLVAFAAPVALAGAVTPLLVGGLARSAVDAGRASGLVGAWGTLGSLAGTFLTTHLLVPELGSRTTIWLAASALAMAGLLARPSATAALAAVLLAGVGFAPQAALRSAGADEELIAEVESSYQFLQVVRRPAVDGEPPSVVLRINEGLDSFHSIRFDGTPWTGGRYYDWFVPLPLLLDGDEARGRPRVLSLGAAAGTFERLFRAAFPGCVTRSVEIDPAVTSLARTHFGAFDDGRVDAGVDARVFVELDRGTWDLILVDCYERQVYVPAHVASREFFAAVGERLQVGGIVAVNCGGVRFDDPVVTAIAGTMAAVFGEASAFRVPRSRNLLLAARKGGALDPTRIAARPGDDPRMVETCAVESDPRRWRRYGPADEPLVDDRPLLDSLHDASLAARGGGGERSTIAGTTLEEEAATAAFDAVQHGDFEAALAAVAGSRRETAYLRLVAGDARWALHDVRGADAEYATALDLSPSDGDLRLLQGRRREVGVAIDALDRASATATRNGWYSALAAAIAAALVSAAARRIDRGA
ncbi:MAG: fused MFS/spermidine synthase [Planctomycetes bacterium]|nr:fused MFS/spermidine synthase [Planctomycetota bacterium]